MIIERTNRFKRAYKKLDKQSQQTINQTLIMLAKDLSHPSLRVKKMKGYHNPDVWEASATMNYRITFEYVKPDILLLRNCGPHDKTLSSL